MRQGTVCNGRWWEWLGAEWQLGPVCYWVWQAAAALYLEVDADSGMAGDTQLSAARWMCAGRGGSYAPDACIGYPQDFNKI